MGENKRGRASLVLPKPPVITAWASVAGKKESQGPLGHCFDRTSQDTFFGQKTWEQAEKKMQELLHTIFSFLLDTFFLFLVLLMFCLALLVFLYLLTNILLLLI